MRILKNIYMNEADDGLLSGGGEPAETPQDAPADSPSLNETPEWLLPKYMSDDRSQEEAISEQAKAYNELQSKFGAFTGAPEEYVSAFNDELTEAGLSLEADDPMVEAAIEFAKKSNMSQEGFNDMLNLYGMQRLAEHNAQQDFKANEMKALGPGAESRIGNINEWASKNLDEQTYSALQGMATTAESVKAIEHLIGMTRSAPVNADSVPSPGASAEEVRAMQFEKDEHGNRKINTDPEFRKRYTKLRNDVYGTDDHKVVIR